MSKDDGLAPSAQMLILFLYICRQAFKETRIQMIDDKPSAPNRRGWRISRPIFRKILGICANLTGSTAREGKRCITFI
jgi:hypothetical protein